MMTLKLVHDRPLTIADREARLTERKRELAEVRLMREKISRLKEEVYAMPPDRFRHNGTDEAHMAWWSPCMKIEEAHDAIGDLEDRLVSEVLDLEHDLESARAAEEANQNERRHGEPAA